MHANAEADTYTDVYADTHRHTDVYADLYADRDVNLHQHTDRDTDVDTYADADMDTERNADRDLHPYDHAFSHADANADGDGHPHADDHAHADTDCFANADVDADGNPDPDAVTDGHPNRDRHEFTHAHTHVLGHADAARPDRSAATRDRGDLDPATNGYVHHAAHPDTDRHPRAYCISYAAAPDGHGHHADRGNACAECHTLRGDRDAAGYRHADPGAYEDAHRHGDSDANPDTHAAAAGASGGGVGGEPGTDERRESRLLTLVVRNDGDLPSDPMTLINVLPVYWRVLGVSASKGLVSIIPGEVRVVLGRIRAREQILVAVTVQAPDVRSADELCVSLRDGVLALPEICGPLPEVRQPSPQLGAGTAQTEATADSSGPRPHLILLGNTIGEALPGQGGDPCDQE